MIDDQKIWMCAKLLVKHRGDNAALSAADRADELTNAGDLEGAAIWRRILDAIEQLQAMAPAGGEGALNFFSLEGADKV